MKILKTKHFKTLLTGIILLLLLQGTSFGVMRTTQIRKGTIRIINTFIKPNYYTPWRVKTAKTIMGSGAYIGKNMIITNAHVVANSTFLQVQKENDPNLYNAKILYTGDECDLALITVENKRFFKNLKKLKIGGVPSLQSKVTTYGYPIGGERISITEGVISRIEIGTYAHSGKSAFLKIQTDAAINSGNSGGPVMQRGKIVGIAFQARRSSNNIGFMIPVPVINHFLKDVRDGRYNGFPSLGIISQQLQNKSFRQYLGMKNNQTGIFVSHVLPGSSAFKIIKKGDVLLKIEKIKIANDGSIPFRGSRIGYSHIIDKKHIHERISLVFLRNKKVKSVRIKLKNSPVRIPWYNEFNVRPRYYIFSGIIFQPLSKEFLKIWRNWGLRADRRMLYYYFYNKLDNPSPYKKEFVVINHVLPDSSNTYISDTSDKIVREVNGRKILSLKDLPGAFKNPIGGYHVIKIEDMEIPIILDAKETFKANQRIMKKYRIPNLQRIN